MGEQRWYHNKNALYMILFAALLLRVGFVVFFDSGAFRHGEQPEDSRFLFPDEQDYHTMAKNIKDGYGAIIDENRVATRSPLYPSFMAAIYKVFGEEIAVVQLMQCLIGILSIYVLYIIVRKIFGHRTGLIAALIMAFYPFFIFFSGLILTETLFILLLLLAMYCLYIARRTDGLPDVIYAGVLLALIVLIRGSFILFPLFLLPFWVITCDDMRRGFMRYLLILFVALIVISPWWARNYRILGHFVPATTQGGASLYEANNPEADGGPMLDRMKVPEEADGLGEYDRDVYLRNAALEHIADNPGRFLELAVIKFGRFWNPVPNYSGYRSPFYIAISLISVLLVMITALIAFVKMRAHWRKNLLLLAPVLYSTILHSVFIGSVRYRVAVMPFIIIFSAIMVSNLLYKHEEDKHMSGGYVREYR